MLKFKLFGIINLFMLFIMSSNIWAEVISFDSIPASSGGTVNNLTESGFLISGTTYYFIGDGASFCSPECPENGTNYLLTQSGNNPISITPLDGGTFDLLSFQYAEQHVGVSYAPQVDVTGYLYGGGTVTASFFLDGINDGSGPLNDFQTAILPDTFQNLTAIDFASTNRNRYSLDNIAINVVPEPISSILFVTGGSLLAGKRYIKRKKKA